jgi:hypothetical protein
MPSPARTPKLREKEVDMGFVFTIVVLGIVLVLVPGVVALAVFEISPFGRHSEHYRDLNTGKRRWDPPNLEDGHY